MASSTEILRRQGRAAGTDAARRRRKSRIFLLVNGIIFGGIGIAVLTNPYANAGSAAYVAILSLLCTLPLLFATNYRGRASLLIVFLAYYFATFGLGDLVQLLSYQPSAGFTAAPSGGGSIAVLLGAFCFLIGYAVTTGLPLYHTASWSAREWSLGAATVFGVACWAIGALANAAFLFGGADPNSGIHINPMIGGFLAMLRFLEPVGSLLLIYLYLTTRNRKILAILLTTMALDAGLGFFGGSKQIAMRAPVLFLLSVVLLRERIPVVALIVFTMVTAVFFNVFQGYRNELYRIGESRSAAFSQVGSGRDALLKPGLPLSKQLSTGLDYFLSRISEKPIIDMVVARTGTNGIRYQDGATLVPLLYAFIPRLVAPGKPNNITGLLFNHAFSLATANTFIAVTNLGDLYWNFGWIGIIIGMTLIGTIMAWAATKFRLDTGLTLPKFLFLVVTVYFLILRFESGIALVYTLWVRVMVLLLLLHAVIPKARVQTSAARLRRGARDVTGCC